MGEQSLKAGGFDKRLQGQIRSEDTPDAIGMDAIDHFAGYQRD